MIDAPGVPLALEGIFFEGIVPFRERRAAPARVRPAPPGPPPPPQQALDFFRWLLAAAQLPAHSYRARPLVRRLPACLRFLGVKTIEDARQKILRRPELARELMNVVLLGVTQFWRDRAVFDHLGQVVFPELLTRRNRLRIWSAACSEGQELYSIAMMLDEQGALPRGEMLGTDCRADAILQARAGLYEEAQLAGLEDDRRRAYFRPSGRGLQADLRLRAQISWKAADLLAGTEPGPWDMILCRNLAIYLENAAAEQVWQGLVAELRPGGCLVVGKADHPPPHLPLERRAPCLYRKIPA